MSLGPRLSVVIPWYGEASGVADVLERVRSALKPVAEEGGYEIVVVDDGSPEDVAAAAREAGADQAVRFPHNRGKGAAVRAGVLAARGRTVAFTDADLAYPPDHLLRLLAAVEAGGEMVVGSRRHEEATALVRGRRLRELSGRVFSLLAAVILLRGKVRDTQCGLKAFDAYAARWMFSQSAVDGFAFDAELFYLAGRSGLRIIEVPVSVANPTSSTVHVGQQSLRMLTDLVRIRLWAFCGRYQDRNRDVVLNDDDLDGAGGGRLPGV
ncbi:MAG: glycosyltransferase [Actinomycetota bacterium]|nr:glycosyltransferase [Actinomycetota bacterium]MDQ3574742.1 glycosyltransferase [Actinomycetota bacterium]